MSITAVMRPITGTSKLQIKFRPDSRRLEQPPVHARARRRPEHLGTPKDPTLGERSDDVWNVIKQVVDLKAPGHLPLRGRSFRWIGAHDKVLGTTVRTSPSCYQPELRPDLQVKTIGVEAIPATPSADEYVGADPQRGATAAGPFQVQFTDGSVVKTHRVTNLRAARADPPALRRAARAPADAPTSTADPGDAVDDLQPRQQLARATCPARASGSRLHAAPREQRAATLNSAMKTDIHPEYVDAHVRCTCGNEFMTRSTKPEIHVEICSACHPFYTGQQKLVDTGGRVERFQRRVAKGRRAARPTTSASA